MAFQENRGLAHCGLACALCSVEDCPGCKQRGCAQREHCAIVSCVQSRGLDGCYACDEFPCAHERHQNPRNRAFNRYARLHGVDALLERLRVNQQRGVAYHRDGEMQGDYDAPETEEGILRLIRFGTHDAYVTCPELETDGFILRLVQPDDAQELLSCYADLKTCAMLNKDENLRPFPHQTVEEMRAYIAFWLACYHARDFVRWTVRDKASSRAVGTVEMFCSPDELAGRVGWGVLRIDLASSYENADAIGQLLALSTGSFYELFGANRMVSLATPDRPARIAALKAAGFASFAWNAPGRAHYWVRDAD